jgi:hypothetical protein
LQDGKTTDLAKLVNAKPNDVIFLRRTATLTKNFSNTMPFLVRTGFRSGRLAMTSGGQVGGRNDLMLHAWNANGKKGNQQLLGKLHVSGDDGQCLFHFQPTAIGRSQAQCGAMPRSEFRDGKTYFGPFATSSQIQLPACSSSGRKPT